MIDTCAVCGSRVEVNADTICAGCQRDIDKEWEGVEITGAQDVVYEDFE